MMISNIIGMTEISLPQKITGLKIAIKSALIIIFQTKHEER